MSRRVRSFRDVGIISSAIDACGQIFMVGGACGCVEACYRESDVEGGCCGGYIHVGVPFCVCSSGYVGYVLVFQ